MDINSIKQNLRNFADERDWDQFHTPKNLSMALVKEASELMELFQWLTPDESQVKNLSADTVTLAEQELADVLIFTIRLSDKLEIDLDTAVAAKMQLNRDKYPVNLAKSNATKYSRR